VIDEQYRNDGWLLPEKGEISAQIEEGFAQAERGELVDAEEAVEIIRKRRENRPFT
jgi:predicted transcriptional regulator